MCKSRNVEHADGERTKESGGVVSGTTNPRYEERFEDHFEDSNKKTIGSVEERFEENICVSKRISIRFFICS